MAKKEKTTEKSLRVPNVNNQIKIHFTINETNVIDGKRIMTVREANIEELQTALIHLGFNSDVVELMELNDIDNLDITIKLLIKQKLMIQI